MFVATATNFLLVNLATGNQVAAFVVSVQKALILDTNFPLSENLELVNKVVRNLGIPMDWAGTISVSTNP